MVVHHTEGCLRSHHAQEIEGISIAELTLEAANEYGANDRHALALYGLDMVIEPFRDTVISVKQSTAPAIADGGEQYHWQLVAEDDDGMPRESTGPVIDSRGGSHVKVQLTEPGRSYRLVVKRIGMDGQVVAEGRATAHCKYVRRELRKLTAADRTAFFEALRVYYTISTPEAYRKYGDDFSNHIRITAIHNAQVREGFNPLDAGVGLLWSFSPRIPEGNAMQDTENLQLVFHEELIKEKSMYITIIV